MLMHRVMIQPARYDTCREAVVRAFDLFPIEVADKTVLVKPNVLRASKAEEGIVTNPAIFLISDSSGTDPRQELTTTKG